MRKGLGLRACRAYAVFLLVMAGLLAVPIEGLVAWALLAAAILLLVREVRPGVAVGGDVLLLLGAPLAVEQIVGPGAVPLSLPLLYPLGFDLQRLASSATSPSPARAGRAVTGTFTCLASCIMVVAVMAVLLGNRVLLLASLALGVYMAVVLLLAIWAVPAQPLAIEPVRRRVIAGDMLNASSSGVSRARMPLRVWLRPVDDWARVTGPGLISAGGQFNLAMRLTPPLAGPTRPLVDVTMLDPRGLIEVRQTIEPVELRVIPRARYARWLAIEYLERSRPGTLTSGVGLASLPRLSVPALSRGTEYYDSRSYQPGDSLRNVDWKHSTKLGQLIVKEFVEGGRQTAVLAVNLSVADAEESDRLAFNLVTAALTLAEEGIPSGLAAYNHRQVVRAMSASDPREILKDALRLVKDIECVALPHRRLALPDLRRLRVGVARLKDASSEPARRLFDLLSFEYRASRRSALANPAMAAITSVLERTPGPALVLLVSQLNHDTLAVQGLAEDAWKEDFVIIPVESPRPRGKLVS